MESPLGIVLMLYSTIRGVLCLMATAALLASGCADRRSAIPATTKAKDATQQLGALEPNSELPERAQVTVVVPSYVGTSGATNHLHCQLQEDVNGEQ